MRTSVRPRIKGRSIFWATVMLALLSPLSGTGLMEAGAYGPSVGREGYSNGASLAYSVYVLAAFIVVWLLTRVAPVRTNNPWHVASARIPAAAVRRIGLLVFIANVCMLQVILWGADGYRVLLAEETKGVFRLNLGQVGAAAFLITKFLAPTLFAYYVLSLRMSSAVMDVRQTSLLIANVVVILLMGAAWGTKATTVSIILAAAILADWVGLTKITRVFLLFSAAVLVFAGAFYFDGGTSFGEVWVAVMTRVTVIHGDVFWEIWDGYWRDGLEYGGYWKTWAAAMGDRALTTIFGLSRENWGEWISWHYDLRLSELAGRPPEDYFEAGTTITGTPAAEGIVALGLPGLVVAGILAGVMIGVVYRTIAGNIVRRPAVAVVASVYYTFVVLPWLIAGGMSQLFHIATITGLVASLFLITAVVSIALGLQLFVPPAHGLAGGEKAEG